MNDPIYPILLDHHRWATRVLLLDAESLSEEQYQRRFVIGLGSIHDTLRHIVSAFYRWGDRIALRPVRDSLELPAPGRNCRPAELMSLLDGATVDLKATADRLAAGGELLSTMQFKGDSGEVHTFTRAAALGHAVTHGMHHRAQVLNIRRQLGLPPLGLELDVVEWECVQTGQITHPLAVAAK